MARNIAQWPSSETPPFTHSSFHTTNTKVNQKKNQAGCAKYVSFFNRHKRALHLGPFVNKLDTSPPPAICPPHNITDVLMASQGAMHQGGVCLNLYPS